jgi:DNA-binding IclR family transcriptional regulator
MVKQIHPACMKRTSFRCKYSAPGRKRFTSATITQAREVRERLEEIRKTGVSRAHGEYQPHLSAVAAPILDERAGA